MELNIEGAKRTLHRTSFPLNVVIEPVARCNYQCRMCPSVKLKRARGEMDFAVFQKAADEIAAEGASTTRLWLAFIGEPLLIGERLFRMIRYAKQVGVRSVHLPTNASLLNREAAQALLATGVDEVLLSMDAYTKATYDRVRVGGNFDQVVRNVEGLLDFKKELHLPTRVVVQFIVMSENEIEVEAFRTSWLQKGAIVKIRPKMGWGKACEADYFNLPDTARDFPCPWLLRGLGIHWDGRFAQCDSDNETIYSPGDIQSQSIREVWNGELARRRDRHWALNFDFEPCRSCKDWQAGLSQFYYPEEQHLD